MSRPLQRRTYLALSAACFLPVLTLQAAAQGSSAPPAEIGSELPGASLAGSTRMRFFGLNIYDARLWVTAGFKPAAFWQSPLALELTYLRSLSGNAIAQRSLDEMRRGGPISQDTAERWLAAMIAAFADVKAADRITGMHVPGQGAKFWLNGQPRPGIKDPEFSRLFFGIWLADHTSEPRLRAELLAGVAP
ncbi:chalcone isomerase family protein [Rhodoferax mekongensis]|uniref:chalcone isomerase family protein n=1 Tax=Rhodoferax mekongensis TaxID=3068341 RepID=UPI0028BE6216|nr:chalcone isomerase family protein [Rhodoferax sp. TBRC 17199]MDT7513565.1 chalcone isomerase family protein [Rhodoferax sp. TBRC 17199]